MRFLIAGATGFLGRHLSARLRAEGHEVVALSRSPQGPAGVVWDPDAGRLDRSTVEDADVVVNLAGSPTAGNPHSGRWARNLRSSRVTTTRLLAEAIASSERKPAFLAGNAIAWYGDHGDEEVTEASDSRGASFLTTVTRDWQDAAQPALDAGARVCVLRTVPVIDRRGAPLKQLLPLFKAGLGGRLGSGEQYMPMISLRDWVGAVTHLAEHDEASGAFNLCCPETPTNAEFTQALGRALGRPTIVPVPAFAIKVGAARMAPELLGSLNTVPQAVIDVGYEFRDQDVTSVLAAGLAQAS